jgi:ribokinase
MKEMRARYVHSELLLTLGAEGAILMRGSRKIRQPAYPVHPIDTTAAGDTFTGYYLAEIARRSTAKVALDRAAKAAAIATTRRGAASSIPTLQEVLDSNMI